MAPHSQAFPPRERVSTIPKPVMASPGSIPIAFTEKKSPDVKKATLGISLYKKVAFNMNATKWTRH
jgi:hypothetical protein